MGVLIDSRTKGENLMVEPKTYRVKQLAKIEISHQIISE